MTKDDAVVEDEVEYETIHADDAAYRKDCGCRSIIAWRSFSTSVWRESSYANILACTHACSAVWRRAGGSTTE